MKWTRGGAQRRNPDMGILDRFRRKSEQRAPERSAVQPYVVALADYWRLAREIGAKDGPDEVRASYGKALERDAAAYPIRPVESLSHPPALIAASLHVALADPGLEQIREHAMAALFELDGYLSGGEREPYAEAIDSVALQFGLIGQPEMRRLLDRDPDAALKMMAALPEPQFAKIEPLQRTLRRRRTARWIALFGLFPDRWTASERAALHSQWMFEQAVDVLTVSSAATEALRASMGPDGMNAAKQFAALSEELALLLRDARAYEDAALPHAEVDGFYASMVYHTANSLRQLVTAITNDDRAAADEASHRLDLMQAELRKLAGKHAELQKLLTDSAIRSGSMVSATPTVQVQAARPERASAEDDAWDPKGFIEPDDDDNGDGSG